MVSDKLVKLLNMSNSTNDHEALTAIRLANKMVNGNWDCLLEPKKVDPVPKAKPKAEVSHYEIEIMFNEIAKLKSYWNDNQLKWFELLGNAFVENGTLSTAQVDTLKGIHRSVTKKASKR